MKILVIGDLHGRKPRILFRDFDCIIQVGDVCDDRGVDPYYKKYFAMLKKNPDLDVGFDSFITKEVGKKVLKKLDKESLIKGRKILEFLNSFGKPLFFVPGNWDQSYGPSRIKNVDKDDYSYLKAFYDWWLGKRTNPRLIGDLKNIRDCQYQTHEFMGVTFLGYGLSSGVESLSRRKNKLYGVVSKKQWERLVKQSKKPNRVLSKVYKKRNKRFPIIFISHNIPYNTKLDVVKDKKSYAHNKHLGSSVARTFCTKHQPVLCIGGHIHEGKGKDKIGRTVVVNPGYGTKSNVLIDFDEKKGKIRKVTFA